MPADLALGFPAPEVAFFEVVHVSRVYGPVVALAVGAPASLYKAVIQRQVVPDRVPPAWASGSKVGVVVQYVLVDVGQHKFAVGRAQYSHGDQPDIAVLRLWLVDAALAAAGADYARVEQRYWEPGRIDASRGPRVHGAHGAPSASGQSQSFSLQRVVVQM